MLEENLQGFDEGARSCLASSAARLGTGAAHVFLDSVNLRNARNRFGGDRRIAALGDLEELTPQVAPAKGDSDPVRRQLLVRRIAVALHDAAIICQQLLKILAASARRVAIDRGRRACSAPGPVIACDCPEVAGLGLTAPRIEHRHRRLIDRQFDRAAPSSMRGQWNLPPSSRLANRHRPVPSQKISFTLSARFARKQKMTPENGSAFNCSFTSAASPSIPLRKSTGFVAISTRIGPGGTNIPELMLASAERRAGLLRCLAYSRHQAPA